jgi:hypothetical protein
MSTDALIAEAPSDVHVVALTPAEMVPAQAELVAWCDRKIRALIDEADELDLHMKLALENGWKTSVVHATMNRTARRITYYQKMQAALQAGYLLVPNMPVDVLAVRVKGARPRQQTSGYASHRFTSPPELLPAGAGRYVDEQPRETSEEYEGKDYQGKPETKTRYLSAEHDEEVDFPFQTMKPVVLEAAARAMALKIFDQIGQVQNSGGEDPILVGQLLDPRGSRHHRRLVTFFIAWWVDTASL